MICRDARGNRLTKCIFQKATKKERWTHKFISTMIVDSTTFDAPEKKRTRAFIANSESMKGGMTIKVALELFC